MLKHVWTLAQQVSTVLRKEEGLETLEWLFMAFLVIATIAVAVYGAGGAGLSGAMTKALGQVTAAI